MENSSYGYARLWLRTSARALLQCHKYISDKDDAISLNKANEDYLLQIKTYLDQLEVSELVEVINYLANEIGKRYFFTTEVPERKFLCYRGVTTEYAPDESPSEETATIDNEPSSHKKKARYYRGALIV